jgi:2-oxo-4-hydroxy-4-carboxy-5-ureidoimidazoline decarboxylase
MRIDELNAMSSDTAHAAFLRCCGSSRWADAMTARRPFASAADVVRAATEIEANLKSADWLEAFAAHPRIGDVDSLRTKFASTADLAGAEQSGVAGTGDDVIRALAEGNRQYEETFGHIFIVCATGKTAAEMLAILRQRLSNNRDAELRTAGGEQAKITRLRLEKL